MKFIRQLIKKPLWVNVLFSITLVLVFLLLFLFSLDLLTHHGKTLTIPSVTGLSYEKASEVLDDQGFDVEIQDSLYSDTAAPLTVLQIGRAHV